MSNDSDWIVDLKYQVIQEAGGGTAEELQKIVNQRVQAEYLSRVREAVLKVRPRLALTSVFDTW